MNDDIECRNQLITKGKYDVVVVGGGIAGIAAAVSASRKGSNTLLIEKQINLGGLATGGLISWYEPLCDGKGTQIIFGIAEELIRLAVKYGFDDLPQKWGGNSNNKPRDDRFSTNFSPAVFSAVLDEYVISNGVNIKFDSRATYPVMENNICKGLIVESVSGSELYKCDIIIDATGDACIMHRAGVPTIEGENFLTYLVHMYDENAIKSLCESGSTCSFRQWKNFGSDLVGDGHPEGMGMLKGTTSEDVTNYILMGKKRMLEYVKKLNKDKFDVFSLPTMPQIRTIRRIVGKTDFNAIDGAVFTDSIGFCGDFRPQNIGKHYEIPLGALYNSDFPNMIAAGRIISAPQGDGWEVARVIPTCAMTGEKAGEVAAYCSKNNCVITELDDKIMCNMI